MKCGIYLRISKEEAGSSTESNSISGQRLIINQYIDQCPELEVIYEWCDDGYSGINFERPGIRKAIKAALNGEIQCLIVKDLSRFGRDYIQTGRYLNYIFPQMNIRFIAVCDNYDSFKGSFLEDVLMMPVLNIVNDAYCRDISRKVKSQQNAKRRNGDYIGAFAVYGYKKDENNHNRLIHDCYAANVVRWIFYERIEGKSAEYIADMLNVMGVPSPMMYKRMNKSNFKTSFAKDDVTLWSPVAVRRILQNEMYTGMMIQGKDRKISYKLSKREKLPREEWICVENAIEPIISREMFEHVQEIILR